MVDINIRLNSDTGSGANLGSARITVPASELTKRGLNLVIKNEKEQQIIDDTFEKIEKEDKIEEEKKKDQKIKPDQPINIRAWFDSETRTYMHRDLLTITVMADKNCWFLVIHIYADNSWKVISPNNSDRDNYLSANKARDIFQDSRYPLYPPYGTETILIVASGEKYKDIERYYNMPLETATLENLRGVTRGGEVESITRLKTFSGRGEARYNITIIEPSEEYEYSKPSDMDEMVETLRNDTLKQGGVFEGDDRSGFYILNNVRASYRTSDRSDKIQLAIYNLGNYNRGGGDSVQTRGSGFNFEFAKPGNISQAVQAVRSGIERKGGTFTGNEQQGSFKASGIAGQYRVSNMVSVTITEKPTLIPNSLIKNEVENFFGGK
jgi:hypothetical protein